MEGNNSLTLDKLMETMKVAQQKLAVDYKPINDFVEAGGSMDNVHLVTSDPQFMDVEQIEIVTTQGIVKVKFSPYVEGGKWYLVNLPKLEGWGFNLAEGHQSTE